MYVTSVGQHIHQHWIVDIRSTSAFESKNATLLDIVKSEARKTTEDCNTTNQKKSESTSTHTCTILV